MSGTKRLRPRNEKNNPAIEMGIALGGMYAISGILLVLLAFLLYQFDLSEAVVQIGIIAIYIAADFFGGFWIGRRMQDKKYLWGLSMGVVYFVLLFLISWISRSGLGEIPMEPAKIVTTLILCAVSAMVGGMFS